MKHIVVLFCILLVSAFALPVAASVGTVTTEPVIIHGVTMEPTFVPTKEPTAEPTREPTKEPTSTQVVVTTPVGPQVGWVTIASTPSGASVTLDGRSVGVTPVAGLEVGAGTSHSVRISMSGYEPYQTSFSVGPGEQAAVDGTLSPLVTPVPTTEPTKAPTAPVTPVQPIGGDKGWFRVNCNVNGALASLDNGAAGTCTIAQGSCSIEVATTGTPVS